MWQRARVLYVNGGNWPPVGSLLWVEGPPQEEPPGVVGVNVDGTRRRRSEPGYRTNLLGPDDGGLYLFPELMVRPDSVELLAEFCEDPERIPWGAWSKEIER